MVGCRQKTLGVPGVQNSWLILLLQLSSCTECSEYFVALLCVRTIKLPVSIEMLQIHTYALLAHWAILTHTTVEDRREKDQASESPFTIVAFQL